MSAETPETPDGATQPDVPERLSYISVPVLVTGLILSMVLLAGALFVWWELGPEIRAQVTFLQAATLLFFVIVMMGIMMALGYSHLWAQDDEVIIRNGPLIRRYKIAEIAGLRLRKGDPWAYLLVKDPSSDTGVRRKATLAIQALEGDNAGKKVRELRRWLQAKGATSEGIQRDLT